MINILPPLSGVFVREPLKAFYTKGEPGKKFGWRMVITDVASGKVIAIHPNVNVPPVETKTELTEMWKGKPTSWEFKPVDESRIIHPIDNRPINANNYFQHEVLPKLFIEREDQDATN